MTLDELFFMVNRVEHLIAYYDHETLVDTLLECGIGHANRAWCEFAIKLANMP